MKKLLLIFFFSQVFNTYCQSAIIDTLYLPKSTHFIEIAKQPIYPIINTGNKNIDSLINYDIKNRFTHYEYQLESIDSTLIKFLGNGIVYMDFEVTYNKNGIISFKIITEGCEAYCITWTDHFNYSTKTGEKLLITSILNDKDGSFTNLVITQKDNQFIEQKKILKEWLITNEIDSLTYQETLLYYDKCSESLDLDNFSLQENSLEIILSCYLPHFMRPLIPLIELKYLFTDIDKYLIIDK
jgi:hypothetical protein